MAVELGHHCVARGGSGSGAQAVPVSRPTSPCTTTTTTRTLKTREQMDWMMAETENGTLHQKQKMQSRAAEEREKIQRERLKIAKKWREQERRERHKAAVIGDLSDGQQKCLNSWPSKESKRYPFEKQFVAQRAHRRRQPMPSVQWRLRVFGSWTRSSPVEHSPERVRDTA